MNDDSAGRLRYSLRDLPVAPPDDVGGAYLPAAVTPPTPHPFRGPQMTEDLRQQFQFGLADLPMEPLDNRDDGKILVAARKNAADCELQYKRDIFQCNMVGLAACYAQAMERYAACRAGRQIPPFNY